MSDIYSKLRAHLHTHLIGAPEGEQILEILRMKYTPDEAEIALHLSPFPQELSIIAKSAGKDEETTRKLLEGMADKGLVETVAQWNGKYALLPTVPGIFETSFGKGQTDPRTEQLAKLWEEYFKSGFGKEVHRAKTPLTRIIPVEKSIGSNLEVLPYEQAVGILKSMTFLSQTNCCCRHAATLAGNGCGKPIDVCMHFEDFGRFLTERGYARQITLDEALEILDRTDKAGLLHMTINTHEKGCFAICSCCSCCCIQMRGISQLHKPGAVATSRFQPVVNADECTGCGTCEERCHFEAIKVPEDVAEIDQEKCIGCGLCVTGCPSDAIALVTREKWQPPIPTIEQLAGMVIQEKAEGGGK